MASGGSLRAKRAATCPSSCTQAAAIAQAATPLESSRSITVTDAKNSTLTSTRTPRSLSDIVPEPAKGVKQIHLYPVDG